MSTGKLRCPGCRSRRATFTSMLSHIQETGHQLCICGGYHFKHRPGSPCCEVNPMHPVHQALRANPELTAEELLDLRIEVALLPGRGTFEECPF